MVSSISNLSDARYCAGMGVDYLGFSIDSTSASFIDPSKFKQITGWISGIPLVAECGEVVDKQLVDNYGVEFIQLNNFESISISAEIQKPIILHADVTPENSDAIRDNIGDSIHLVSFFVLNFSNYNHLISCSDWISGLISEVKIFLKTNFQKRHLDSVLALNSSGLVLQGGLEEKVGLKDYDDLADILEAIQYNQE